MDYKYNRAWAEIDIGAIINNIKETRKITDPHAQIMGIVKADAYGHGVMEIARTMVDNGITSLGVATLDEAIELRKNGIKSPILILSYTDPRRAKDLIKYDISQTIYSHELAKVLSDAAVEENTKIKVHIKIDTGMGRVGFLPGYRAVKDVLEINKLEGIICQGLFTHFSKADTDEAYTNLQFDKFMSIVRELERIGIHIPYKHVANSSAIIKYPHMHLDMVRAGLILYGHYPSQDLKDKINLKAAMTLKAGVNMAKTLEKDSLLGYGGSYIAKEDIKLATITIGYADGYMHMLSNKARVLINGQYANIVGNICMDQCMADVSDHKIEPKLGDEVVLFGGQADKYIDCKELADIIGTINYELICLVGKRIPRIYVKDGQIINVLNYLV